MVLHVVDGADTTFPELGCDGIEGCVNNVSKCLRACIVLVDIVGGWVIALGVVQGFHFGGSFRWGRSRLFLLTGLSVLSPSKAQTFLLCTKTC